ncbi:MAG: pyruvate formate-lyase-activating protein [Lachnospiraceae bacterium]|nr:pyruvate formate-lyase-activating protein [Lachnospiraceae bacterium]MDY5742062.1 pyruvate formate-lyase-activating protein [Lachnospiraceae bacterium]
MEGYIHSLESFGTVDGPGTRFVVFFQGCPLRCQYCHNPDTWKLKGGRRMTVEEILTQYEKNRPFYREGGLTATGGEAMLQLDFLTELFKEAKQRDIHTCLDTSGITYRPNKPAVVTAIDELLSYTDLIMLDIKHIHPIAHMEVTGQSNENILRFAEHLNDLSKDVWIRHVVVPGLTNHPDDLYQLGYFIGKLRNVKALDVLPYHTLGAVKYQSIGIPYPLEGIPDLSKQEALIAKGHILSGIRDYRREHPVIAR